MKLLGLILIIACGTAAGMLAASALSQRLTQSLALIRMLGSVSERLRYLSPSVQSLIKTLAAQYPELSFLENCRQRLDAGVPFDSAFRLAVEESDLSTGEKEILTPLAAELGRTDLDSQLASLSYAVGRLEEYSRQEQSYVQTHGKLYRALGALGGIALAIILL